jgi:hypothetical protein
MKGKLTQRITSPVSMTLILLAFTLLICDYNFTWKNDKWKYAVNTDAADYYRYLPMVFINHHFDDKADNPAVIKYFTGPALLYLPFFAIACAGSYMSGLPVDGYSLLFPIMISIGTLFYLLFGLHFLSKFLKYYISRTWVICIILLAITFATVTFYYTVNTPGWAHIVAFGLVCFLLYHFKKIAVDFNRLSIIAIIAGTSMLFFTRPTDVTIVIVAPFLAGDLKNFRNTLKNIFAEKKAIFTGIFLAAIPLICQLAVYRIATGEFWVWSYTKEGFNFLHPEITNELFSYAKGLFVYSPVCFISLFGLFRLFKINRFLFTGIVIYMAVNIYIISSWWCWNYGYSYGPRAFIEHFPLFFFLLALLMDVKNVIMRGTVIFIIILLSFLNLFQIYQTSKGILDQDYKTDAKGYWDVFLSTEKGYSGKFYRYPVDESHENIIKRTTWFNDMERKDTSWLNPDSQSADRSHSGKYSSKVNANNPYSVGIRKSFDSIPYRKNVLIRASGWFFIPTKGSDSYFSISFVNNGKMLNFNPFKLDGYTEHFNQWEYHVFEIYMPKFTEKEEKVQGNQVEFYYFNNSDIDCYIDDLKIEFIEFKRMDRVLDLSWE